MKRVDNPHWQEFPHHPQPQFWISHLSLRHDDERLIRPETEVDLATQFQEAYVANIARLLVEVDATEPIIGLGMQVETDEADRDVAYARALQRTVEAALNSLVQFGIDPATLMYEDSYIGFRPELLASIGQGHEPDVRQDHFRVDPAYGRPTFFAARDELTDFSLGLADIDDIVGYLQKEL